ncbi:MAG: hypothetical protein AB1512_02860 [Thermodesulfobacteriota bacterium]
MDSRKSRRKGNLLLDEAYPLTQHNDIWVIPAGYSPEEDMLYLEVMPRSGTGWAESAYQFGRHEGMKYDPFMSGYGVDGQPRVSLCGQVWVRFVNRFLRNSRVSLHIWSQQPSHEDAEEQLARFYGLFREREGLEPIEVFRKYHLRD